MQFLLRISLGFLIAVVLVSGAAAFPLCSETETKPQKVWQCDPSGGAALKQVPPTYPPEAISKGIEGTVKIRGLINKNGIIEKFEVISGPPELVEASLNAIRQWRYEPYELNGVVIRVETSITLHFKLPHKKLYTLSSNE